jgi:hypothetical protein
MLSRRLLALLGAIALGASALALSFGSNSSAVAAAEPVPTTGYTVIDDGTGLCDLYSIDLATGILTDLPAPSSDAACVLDLAVAPNGTVYGITGTRFLVPGSVAGFDGAGGAELVTFSATGVPSGQSLNVGGFPVSGVSGGSIAVNAAGVVYVIAINETTCDSGLRDSSLEPALDSYAYHCLYTVDLTNGELTQIGEGFSPFTSVYGLTSCSANMWTIAPGLTPLSVPNEPATVSLPWYAIDPATGVPTPAGATSDLLGYDCLANGTTVYALQSSSFGVTSSSIGTAVGEEHMLGTVDPNTGLFTPTVSLSDPSALLSSFLDFAVGPPPVVPDPVTPIFTR